jgi:hypothetical protein
MSFPNGGRFRILSVALMILAGHACLGWLEVRERRNQEEALRRHELSIVSAALGLATDPGSTRLAELPAAAVALLEARGARGIALSSHSRAPPPPGEGRETGTEPGAGAVTAEGSAPAGGAAGDIIAILAAALMVAFAALALLRRAGPAARGSAALVGIVLLPLAVAQLILIVVDASRAETANQRRLTLIEWGLAEVFQGGGEGGREAVAAVFLDRVLVQVPSLVALDLRSPTGAPLAAATRAPGLAEAFAAPLRRAVVTGSDRPVHTADLTARFARSLDPSGRIAMVLTASGLALVLGMVGAWLADGERRRAGAGSGRRTDDVAACAAIVLLAGATGFIVAAAESAGPAAGLAAAASLAGLAAGLLLCSRSLVGRPWRGVTFAMALASVVVALVPMIGMPAEALGPVAMGVATGAMLGGLQARLVAARHQAGLRHALGRLWLLASAAGAGGVIVAGLAEPGVSMARWAALGVGLAGVLALAGVSADRPGPLQLLVRSVRAPGSARSVWTNRRIAAAAAVVLGCAAALAGAGTPAAMPSLLCGVLLQPALSGPGGRAGAVEAGFWMLAAPALVVAIPVSGMPGGLAFATAALLVGIGLGRLVMASAPGLVDLMRSRSLDRGARLGTEAAALSAGAAVTAASCAGLVAILG